MVVMLTLFLNRNGVIAILVLLGDFANAGTVGGFSHIFQQKESVGQLSAQHNVLSPTLVTIVEGPQWPHTYFGLYTRATGEAAYCIDVMVCVG